MEDKEMNSFVANEILRNAGMKSISEEQLENIIRNIDVTPEMELPRELRILKDKIVNKEIDNVMEIRYLLTGI